MPANNLIVAVTFCADRIGRRRLSYAVNLAELTDSTLLVVLPPSKNGKIPNDAGPIYLDTATIPAGMPVLFSTDNIEANIKQLASDPNRQMMAVVSNDEPAYDQLVRIACKDEDRVFRNGKREILLPFGPGDAGIRTLRTVLPLANLLGASLRLYHTTWRNESVASGDARDHMRSDAKQTMDELQTHGPFVYTIETASEVDAGINHAALRGGASLVAMSRGRRVIMGGYLNGVRERSPVPTLIVP